MVDPITITYSVVNITSCVLTTAKSLSDLRDKYNNAHNTINAICTESSVISASLAQIQSLLLRDGASNDLDSHFANRPELRDTFDNALSGCTIVYACLEEEIQRLAAGARDADTNIMTWKVRCRFIWREDTMRDLLSQLRGQQMALNLLIQMLQLQSLQELKQLVRDSNQKISQVAQRSRSLRETHPRIRVSSVFSRDRDSVLGRTPSVSASTIDQTEFEFDDAVVNSKAYRRALAAAQKRPATGRTVSEPVPDTVSDTVPDVETLKLESIKQEIEEDQDSEDEADISKDKDIEKGFSTTATELKENTVQPDIPDRKGSMGTISSEPSIPTERKPSKDMTPPGSAGIPPGKPWNIPTPPWESPRTNLPRVQRKPLPSGRHILMPSASMSTLATLSTASEDNTDTISRVSTTTTAAPSIFSTGSNPATNSTISLPNTIDSASEPDDDDDDANTLVESLCSPSTTSFQTTTPNPELDSIHQHLLTTETFFLNKLTILHTFIEEPLTRRWPAIWTALLALHQTALIRHASTQHLVEPLKRAKAAGTPTPHLLLKSLRRFLKAASPAYTAYFAQHPDTASALRARCEPGNDAYDPAFAAFVETFGRTHSLDDLLRQPLRRLDAYVQLAARLRKAITVSSSNGDDDAAGAAAVAAAAAIEEQLQHLHASCTHAHRAALHVADLHELHRRLGGQPALLEQLDFLADGRRVVRMGPLAGRVGGKGPWKPVTGVVMDNYVFFGRWERASGVAPGVTAGKKGFKVDVGAWVEKPIPSRGVECSISGSLRKPAKAGVMDDLPRGTELYPFFVQNEGVVHLLAASTEGERREWMGALESVRSG
ncbi:Ankyrin repeat protein [Lasiodiplodia theobromae]|uniref:Ankyrin repeat protein n=1 Tax=Lasiodiplodia theobromae TaxID=45133 RepID=UPI0015C3DB94|nr:Ankyrin repeat protein [Lasiodiplodia theobromae]KAF4546047.1 Ankyrin repeat protein [Lasiodiplodia theobromae]